MSNELVTVQTCGTVAAQQAPDPRTLLAAVLQGSVGVQNVEVAERIMAMIERQEARQAKATFEAALAALQSETCRVQATKSVPDKQGNIKFRFAPYEEIMRHVSPLLQKHGFRVSFSEAEGAPAGKIIMVCTLAHKDGHEISNRFAFRVGQGPYGASDTQADGAAITYAKRYALANLLNIVVETDTDARAEGGPITKEQAADLWKRVQATGTDQAAFLRFAGATSFAEIPSGKYAALDSALRRKEKEAGK